VGGKGLSQMGSHGAVSLSVCRSVGRSVVSISRKAVSKKERKECILVGRHDKKEGSRRLDIYRKMPRH
jgi:hypothetical protein